MKILIFILFLLSSITLIAQTEYKIKVIQTKDSITTIELPFVTPPLIEKNTNNSIQVGISIPANIDFMKTASLIKEDKERLLYGLCIKSPNALALYFVFNQLNLPSNSTFYFKDIVNDTICYKYSGNFTLNSERTKTRKLSTNKILMLLDIPKEDLENTNINIESISHIYKDINLTTILKASSECDYDVACYPDYTKWVNEISSNIAISYFFEDKDKTTHLGYGSGVFINVSNNYTPVSLPYILTAAHLGEYCYNNGLDLANEISDNWDFIVNSNADVCNATFQFAKFTKNLKLVYANPYTHGDTQNDFMLLQSTLPVLTLEQYNVAFSGWDLTRDYTDLDNPATPFLFFHHGGNSYLKKYAESKYCPYTFRGVLRFAIQTGYTKAGASGSGVYGSDHKLVGINVEGVNTCENPNLQGNYVVKIAEIAKVPAIKSALGSSPITHTFNPNFTNLPYECYNCIADKYEKEVDCGGPCRPCEDPISTTILFSDNKLPLVAKSTQDIIVDGTYSNITLKSGSSSKLYAQGKIKLKGNFKVLNGTEFFAKSQNFFPEENRGCKSLCLPTVPNVFTPNNDGINDTYILLAPNAVKYEFYVWDENGKAIYQKKDNVASNHPIEIWDGSGIKYDNQVVYARLKISDCPNGLVYDKTYFIHTYSSLKKSGQLPVESDNIKDFAIYPNPTSGIVNLKIPDYFSNKFSVEVINISGEILFKENYETKNASLDLSPFANGSYIISLKDHEYSLLKLIMKN